MARFVMCATAIAVVICGGCASDSLSGRGASQRRLDATSNPALTSNPRVTSLLDESFDTSATRDQKRRSGQDQIPDVQAYERLNGNVGP
jgi:hypothetical protein